MSPRFKDILRLKIKLTEKHVENANSLHQKKKTKKNTVRTNKCNICFAGY